MFEQYTERARRVIFFARYEASQYGSTTIESEHLLLGLLREDKNLATRFLRNSSSVESIRSEIEGRITIHQKVSTSVDLSLTNECKRILGYAAEEAEHLKHRHIGTEHLLLGILREENCLAAAILNARGLRLTAIREQLSRVGNPSRVDAIPEDAMVPDSRTAILIAIAIWTPVYGADSIPSTERLTAEAKFGIWQISGDPLFAAIRSKDGEVLAMGKKADGSYV